MLALDGRLARRESTRAAVVDALLALIEAGDLRPTAPRIAERAGVSLRSVFQHFADLEALFAAAADRQLERLQDLVRSIATTGPTRARLDAFVRQRTRLLEAIAPVRRAALLMEPFSVAIAERLRGARALARSEVERAFAPELRRCRPATRRELVAALAAASDWSTWEALRAHQGLSAAAARRIVTRMLGALLTEAT
jgi:TetR/AcrR family transcriptional regulator, regulator of autoinduction and epiphytic fitness